ncbi:hypothetical protein V866_003574 [Kwoniella sp. B9012]
MESQNIFYISPNSIQEPSEAKSPSNQLIMKPASSKFIMTFILTISILSPISALPIAQGETESSSEGGVDVSVDVQGFGAPGKIV